jgi:hypothetical protein
MDHASWAESFLEFWKVLFRGIIPVLGPLLYIKVIEIAEEFVETMVGGQKLILIAKMILPELACGISYRF